MSGRPWFKLYAADVLTDEKIDALPPEALGLILKIWCVCHIEGKCPAAPKELARKTRLPLEYVLQCKSQYESLFDLHNGFYTSARMEKEKRRSDINRTNANERYKERTCEIRSANGTANNENFALQRSDSDSIDSKSSSFKRGTRIPEEFKVTQEHRDWAKQWAKENHCTMPSPDSQIAGFLDYWRGIPGQKGVKLDWDGTFRNWLRRALPTNGSGHQQSPSAAYPSVGTQRSRELAERKAQGL